MRLEYVIIVFVGLLTVIVFGLILSAPDDIPVHTELSKINQQGILVQEAGNEEQLDKYGSQMQKRIESIARDSLGLDIFTSDVHQAYFPLKDGSKVEIPKGKESFQICDIAENIPIHLQNISKTERFQLYAEKYSDYPMELFLQDERRYNSLFHYGLIAASDDGRTALTHFHANSCTNQIADSEKYSISCHVDGQHRVFSTVNKDDVLASLNHPDFCTIPLDPWRQSVYEYNQKIQDLRDEHLLSMDTGDKSYESVSSYESESRRLSMLSGISSMYVMAVDDERDIEKEIQKYNEQFGPMPEEFLQILETKK